MHKGRLICSIFGAFGILPNCRFGGTMKSKLGRLGLGVAIIGVIALTGGRAYAAWNIEHVVDTNTWAGDTCSIAVDAQGRPHIAYAVAAMNYDHLYYATKAGSAWSIQLVKTNCISGNFSRRVSISIDTNGRPHICFGGYIGGNSRVYHAYSASGTSWSFETIDSASIGRGIDSAFDSAGRLHVSYVRNNDDSVNYAVRTGSSWSTPSMITNAGSETSIATDSQGFPHVAFKVSSLPSSVYYAAKTNGSWTLSRIETNGVSTTGNPGISIAMDTNGNPHVSWLNDDLSYSRLMYATKSGASWVKETIGSAGPCGQLLLKPDNTPMAAYFNRHDSPWQLVVAVRSNGVWQRQAVEANSGTNYLDVIYLGVALDKSLNPHLAYCNNWGGGAMHRLKYTCQTGDRDSDGLLDQDEVYIYGTDPDDPDTDGDGLSDGAEVGQHHTDPLDPDSDSDGLSDYYETVTMPCLNPLDEDTDGDGTNDGQEVADGTPPCGDDPSIRGEITYGGSQTGTIYVTASSTTGRTDWALSLDGADDGASVESPTPALRLSTNHSFCAWINLEAMPTNAQATILMKYNDTNNASYVVSVDKSNSKLRYSIGGSSTAYSTSTISASSGWTHVAFTHDGSVGRWYINGILDSSMTFESIQRWGDGALYIGRAIDLQTYFGRFEGGVDEVSLWNRTLSQAEVQYAMGNSLAGTESGLAGYWDFNDGAMTDMTTNANHGEFLSGATTSFRAFVYPSFMVSQGSPGNYAFTNVPLADYNVSAYLDSSANGSNDPWEVRGRYLGNPLSVTGAMAGIDIALRDPVADEDADGLTDYDETYVYGTLWDDPDSDGDGMLDGDEVLAGSQPTNPASVWGIAIPTFEGTWRTNVTWEDGAWVTSTWLHAERCALSWATLTGRTYRLYGATNVQGPWESNSPPISGTGSNVSYTTEDVNPLKWFFRVGVGRE